MKNRAKTAIVLLSGGLDSATVLYLAKKNGFHPYCLVFDYGQRHRKEIAQAKRIAKACGCKTQLVKIKLPWKGSSLLDRKIKISRVDRLTGYPANRIPGTYVPGRNIIFLSFALSYAEAIKAKAIFIGAHVGDYSGYPDCRADFFRAYAKVISCGTKAGAAKEKIKIYTPLIRKSKAEIIAQAVELGVPLGLSWSCYKGGERPCGKCESCYYRAKGFREAGIKDPALIIRR